MGSYTWFEAGLERFDKNAKRPEDTNERDPNPPAQGGQQEQRQEEEAEEKGQAVDDAGQEESSGESPHSSTSSFVVVNGGQDQGPSDLPNPYLPVYTLRPVQPSLSTEQPDTLHHTLNPNPDWTIQCNKTATRAWTTHKVVWAWDDDMNNPKTAEELRLMGRGQGTGTGVLVRDLKLGDMVTVWAKARFGGWANHVQNVRMDVYWAL